VGEVRLEGKTAIVTGAGSGIGLATARRLAAEGAAVVLADVRDARAEAEAIAAGGGAAYFVRADVTSQRDVRALVEEALATYGAIDVLVNNAGVAFENPLEDTTVADWDRLMAVNLKGVFLCCRAAIPVMRRAGGGSIVNVASELGLVGTPDMTAYCASKGGVVQLTRETALLEGILAGSEDPGEERRGMIERAPMKRLGRPEEIANVILFLASDEAGSAVPVDGGWTAR